MPTHAMPITMKLTKVASRCSRPKVWPDSATQAKSLTARSTATTVRQRSSMPGAGGRILPPTIPRAPAKRMPGSSTRHANGRVRVMATKKKSGAGAPPSIVPDRRVSLPSTRHALVVVLRAERLEQRERFRPRLDALHGTVGHVGRGLAFAVHRLDVGPLRHEVFDHLDVAARGRVVQRRVALVVR